MAVDNVHDAAAEPAARPSAPRVEVITRAGCHLCEPVLEAVARVCGELGVEWVARDVDADPALLAAWSDLVPATLVDGAEHAHWFLEEEGLRAALRGASRPR
jgi:hypothetical protein